MKRSKHSLTHENLLSCDMGELIPIACFEALPGDTLQHATSALLRVSPLLAPVMHSVHARIHHWFVPNRLIWDDWEDFITGGSDGADESEYPTITLDYTAGSPDTGSNIVGSLADYLGSVPKLDGLVMSALPFRAYALIFNEWYRDQDLVTPLVIDTTSGADTTTNTDLQNVAWEKDYFTSARPWTQKGPDVSLPLGTSAPVTGIGSADQTYGTASQAVYETDGSGTTVYADADLIGDGSAARYFYVEEDPNNAGFPNIRVDLSNATAASVNDLRLALALQRYEEARARYGSRFVEYLRYLGVRSSDARLQRPEYLGGGRQVIQFSEVLQTAEGSNPVGELRGHGITALRSNRYRRFFEEHGWVISLLSVRPKTVYTQGLHRSFNRRTKTDFWQRELEHIGQQPVENREIYADAATPTDTFGYQDRYDEYRRIPSGVHGEFREDTLNFWHYARIFGSEPTLNGTFVTSTPTKRVNAVETEDVLWCKFWHSIQARRLVSKRGKPYIF